MDLDAFRRLLTPAGQQALAQAASLAPREKDFLAHFQALSKRLDRELARAALEVAILRLEAAEKFPGAKELYFTRPALEQASNYAIATYRAARFTGLAAVADLACSVGGDTLALAEVAPTLGVDHDPLRLAMAQANLRSAGLGARAHFIQADLIAGLPLGTQGPLGLFCDPARRDRGRRIHSVRHYQPSLEIVTGWRQRFPALAVKISPGVDLSELSGLEAELEFISLDGALKEAVLWFGPLQRGHRRATLLPGPHSLTEEDQLGDALPVREPGAFLYEPDPAVLRAGLVAALGQRLDAAQLDPDIAYLTAGRQVRTPFARVWAVEDWMPFGLKRLRAYLRERGVGRVVVKKRGSPWTPEDLIQALRLRGDGERVIFLTHLRGRPIVVIASSAKA